MTSPAEEDRRLVALAQGGDFGAFESLVSKYERRVYTLALRIVRHAQDAEEVVQQTFLSLVEHLGGFRGESSFYTWVMRIATNHALALLRKRSVRSAVSLDADGAGDSYSGLPHPDYIAVWRETPDQIASRRETRRLVDEALDKLDDKYRLVFLLRDIEGLSTRETAEALGITPENVKVRLLRARLMLRERLTRVFGDEATRVAAGHDHH